MDVPPCPRCGSPVMLVESEVYKGSVGYYCGECGGGMRPVRGKDGESAEQRALRVWRRICADYNEKMGQ